MFKNITKNKFFLQILSVVLMFISFIYIYIDINREGNTYKQDVKETTEAKQEAEAAILFSELKEELDIEYISTTKKDFEWKLPDTNPVTINGWTIVGMINPSLVNIPFTYFNNLNLRPNSLNSITTANNVTVGFDRGDLVCIFNKTLDNINIEIFCGYIRQQQ